MDEQLLRDSIHAINQWQKYGIEQRGKSQAGYFSNGGWAYETLEKLRSELVAYLNGNSKPEVVELKRKLAEVEGERDALRGLNAELLAALHSASLNSRCGCFERDYCKCTKCTYAKLKIQFELLNSPIK